MTSKKTSHVLRQRRYDRACWWLERGVDVVPLKPRSKHLYRGYGMRKAHISDVAGARRWFLKTHANLAVVLGQDAGLIVADWDRVRDYEAWRETTGASVVTLTERTARGYHLFFIGRGLKSVVGNGCEFKADGVCAVSPSIHPSGVPYRIIQDVPIAHLDGERARYIFPFLSEVRSSREPPDPKRVPTKRRKDKAVSGGVIARIKAARSTVDEMRAAGVRLRPGGQRALVGLCPFHDDHHPSLWVNPKSGLWGCYKPSCPAAGVHDVINFRALTRGISNRAAIREMAREFLP
jgi:hypothetical protein